jgi:DNA-binding transcriptional ArsR family regulator
VSQHATLYVSLCLLAEDVAARLVEPDDAGMETLCDAGAFDGLVEIADLLNRAAGIAARPGVRRLLQEATVTDPASRRLQAMLASGGCQPAKKEEPAPAPVPTRKERRSATVEQALAQLQAQALTIQQLADALNVSRPTASLRIQQLRRLHLVEAAGKAPSPLGQWPLLWRAVGTNGNGNTNGKGNDHE